MTKDQIVNERSRIQWMSQYKFSFPFVNKWPQLYKMSMTINTRSLTNYHGTLRLNNKNLSGIIVGATSLTCNNFQHDDTCSCPCIKQPWSNHTGVAMSSPHHYHQPNQSCVEQASLSCPSSPSPTYRCLGSLEFFLRDCSQKNTIVQVQSGMLEQCMSSWRDGFKWLKVMSELQLLSFIDWVCITFFAVHQDSNHPLQIIHIEGVKFEACCNPVMAINVMLTQVM